LPDRLERSGFFIENYLKYGSNCELNVECFQNVNFKTLKPFNKFITIIANWISRVGTVEVRKNSKVMIHLKAYEMDLSE